MIITETKRLILRETNPDDAEHVLQLNSDPEVTRYTGDSAFSDLAEARRFLQNYTHFKTYGFGRWAVVEKESNLFLGWCGLKYTEALDEHDIGFRFFKKYWNCGYASESALACLQLGFEKFGIKKIVGRATKENKASIRVLEKIGLQYEKEIYCEGEITVIYSLLNPSC